MQLRTRVIGAAGIAAVVAAGGSAFTASNTVPQDKKLGFDQTSVTGAVASAMDFTPEANADELSKITYTLTPTDTTRDANAYANIKVGLTTDSANALTNYPCVVSDPVAAHDLVAAVPGLITCITHGLTGTDHPADLTVRRAEVVQLVVTPKL